MQQTQTYKLNLLETSDAFSPSPLNENMEKVETKLAALDGTAADLQSRVTALELKKIACGHYIGTGGNQTVDLGFAPVAVVVGNTNCTLTASKKMGTAGLGVTETGFRVYGDYSTRGSGFSYVAFG